MTRSGPTAAHTSCYSLASVDELHRRRFLTLIPAAALVPQIALAAGEEDVTPTEDLMREDGVLERVLMIYDHVRGRIAAKERFPAESVTSAANITRTFIEGYHEKLEEEHLFLRFRKKNTLVDLVDTLETQHKAGRKATDAILTFAKSGDVEKLAHALHRFVRMYAPHEAREDTVLFPAFRKLITKSEYATLGDQFERSSTRSSAARASKEWWRRSARSRRRSGSSISRSSLRAAELVPA